MGEERGKASKHRQRKREAEEAGKVEVGPGVTVASLRRFRVALIGVGPWTDSRTPQAASAVPIEKPET